MNLQHLEQDRQAATVAAMVRGWDHLEWWVGNARAFCAWLCSGFGFEALAYSGPETWAGPEAGPAPDRVSYLLSQGDVRFVVSAGLGPDSEVTRHVRLHGDGVKVLALATDDPVGALSAAQARGAKVLREPTPAKGPAGEVVSGAIGCYGDTELWFVDRSAWKGLWGPGFEPARLPLSTPYMPVGLKGVDHVVGNVEQGRLDEWVSWFEEVLGFVQMRHFDAEQISTAYSALRSTVVWNEGSVVMPINEPAPGLRKSQIAEYLEAYRGPGVQHVALSTDDICTSVESMRQRGVRFLDLPDAYFEEAARRVDAPHLDWATLRRLGVEVDSDSGGYLLQIFTETLCDRPTVFVELIERQGARGFGEGNFKALFEAIEREQARRHNL